MSSGFNVVKVQFQPPECHSLARRYAICLAALAIFTSMLAASGVTPEEQSVVSAWLRNQTNVHTWQADLTQTRMLKTFTTPLSSTGRVWFVAPSQFRWELGNQTIAVRQADQMLVIYPKLKRVERYPLAGDEMGRWKDTLSLLEAGFPRNEKELESRFKILSIASSTNLCEMTLQPRSAAARKMMPQLKIAFDTRNYSLRATELQFADGSTMRNDFFNEKLNQPADASLFDPKIEPDFKIVEPLRQR